MEVRMVDKASAYAERMQVLLQGIVQTQMAAIQEAAELIANAIANDGILYTFGTGHSHVIAEDVSYRAGGLAPVDAMNEPSAWKVWPRSCSTTTG
jgi:uncharacterized phosphosugar-binding protein